MGRVKSWTFRLIHDCHDIAICTGVKAGLEGVMHVFAKCALSALRDTTRSAMSVVPLSTYPSFCAFLKLASAPWRL